MRYRVIDELAHFRFHDARIVRQEWEDGRFVWLLEALNVTTEFSGCDFMIDQEITLARVTFEDARVLRINVAPEGSWRPADADEAERLIAAYAVSGTWRSIFDLHQEEERWATIDVIGQMYNETYSLTLAFSRVLIEWDAYKGAAWYTNRASH